MGHCPVVSRTNKKQKREDVETNWSEMVTSECHEDDAEVAV